MKQVIIIAIALLSILLQACNSNSQMREPKQIDIVGTWKSSEQAVFIFKKNGTFTANQIPAEFGFFPADSFRNKKFNGSGKWELRKGAGQYKEVYLDFDKVSLDKNGCAFPLMIAGRNGVLDNKPPWYLFVWREEEGGERYEFTKQ